MKTRSFFNNRPSASASGAKLLFLVGCLAGIGLCVAERPNVLLVLSDDHSYPHLGCYEEPNISQFNLTPNLDAFARDGVVFERAYTTAPQCAPSRISMFAGRNPVELGVTRFAQPARPDVPFFTDLLRTAGYWVGTDGRGAHLEGRGREYPHIVAALEEAGMGDLSDRFDQLEGFSTKGKALETVDERFSAALDKVGSDRPFFLYFGFSQTHRRFAEDYGDIDPAALVLPPDWPDLTEVREDYARFLGDIRRLDHGFGLLMDVLEERDLADNTLVIFMGDNGEPLYRGKGTLYTRGIHVPLVARWPERIPAGIRSDSLISGIDIAPTVLAATAVEPAPKMTGRNFLPEPEGQYAPPHRYVFAERGWHFGPITETEGLNYGRSVTSDRYHFIYNAQPYQKYAPVDQAGRLANVGRIEEGEVNRAQAKADSERGDPPWRAIKAAHRENRLSALHRRLYFDRPLPIFELYDLAADPFQLNNLAGQPEHEAMERQLREQLDVWMVQNHDYLPLPTHAYQETPPTVP